MTNRASSDSRIRARAKRFVRGTRLKPETIERLLRDATQCGYCGKPIDALAGRKSPRALHIDHRKPKGRGGTNALANLHAVCRLDNLAKGSLLDEEYRALLGFLGGYPEMKTRVLRRLAASKAWY